MMNSALAKTTKIDKTYTAWEEDTHDLLGDSFVVIKKPTYLNVEPRIIQIKKHNNDLTHDLSRADLDIPVPNIISKIVENR